MASICKNTFKFSSKLFLGFSLVIACSMSISTASWAERFDRSLPFLDATDSVVNNTENFAAPTPYEFAHNLFRGPRPESKEQLHNWIAENKITKVISLDDYYDDQSQKRKEENWVREANAKWVHYPMHHLKGPNLNQLKEALKLLIEDRSERVYLHCQHGKDRTGFVVAAYRMSEEGKSLREAKDELYEFGHSRLLFFWDRVLDQFSRSIGQ